MFSFKKTQTFYPTESHHALELYELKNQRNPDTRDDGKDIRSGADICRDVNLI